MGDSSNAEDFFMHTAKELSEYPPPYALEFGNELGGSGGIQAHLNASIYASDFVVFKNLVKKAWPLKTPKTVLADTAFHADWTQDVFDRVGRDVPEIYTWHTYYLGAGVDP